MNATSAQAAKPRTGIYMPSLTGRNWVSVQLKPNGAKEPGEKIGQVHRVGQTRSGWGGTHTEYVFFPEEKWVGLGLREIRNGQNALKLKDVKALIIKAINALGNNHLW